MCRRILTGAMTSPPLHQPCHPLLIWFQTALLQKNLTVLRRQRLATGVRLLSGMIVVALIALINNAWMSLLSESLTLFRDLPNPPRHLVEGIPSCGQKCIVFGYVPAPRDEFRPDKDFVNLADFIKEFPNECPSTCTVDSCNAAACSSCCALHRIHKVVRGIMRNNGTDRGTGEGGRIEIAHNQVMGFKNDSSMDDYLWHHPGTLQGNYIFSSPDAQTVTFLVQQNSSIAMFVRKVLRDPYKTISLPMQVAAEREIARQVFLNDESIEFEVAISEFPHPQKQASTLEGRVAPEVIPFVLFIPMFIQVRVLP